jgi:ATP-dependent Clp protease protease subunit
LHTGRSVEQVSEDTERDPVLDAARAVAYRLVDDILETRKKSSA